MTNKVVEDPNKTGGNNPDGSNDINLGWLAPTATLIGRVSSDFDDLYAETQAMAENSDIMQAAFSGFSDNRNGGEDNNGVFGLRSFENVDAGKKSPPTGATTDTSTRTPTGASTDSSSAGLVNGAVSKAGAKYSEDYFNSFTDREVVGKFFDAIANQQSGKISIDSGYMKGLTGAFNKLFERFATSYEYCNLIIKEVLQNGDKSGVHSPVYGVELRKFWEENASIYEDFSALAGNWVDLVIMTCNKDVEAAEDAVELYYGAIDS